MRKRFIILLAGISFFFISTTITVESAFIDYSELVRIPASIHLNAGLSPAAPGYLRYLFGTPGALTAACSEVTNLKFRALMVTRDVGPEVVSGLKPAVEALERIFAAVKHDKPDLYEQLQDQETELGTTAMLCVRAVVGLKPSDFSTHSWGVAIDIAVNGKLNPVGRKQVQRGLLELYPYFHDEGFYWGGGFLPNADAMHFEVSREQLAKWRMQKLF